jgi:hypothetical protein
LEQPDSGILEETSDFGEPGFEEGTDERNEPNSVFPEAIPGGQALLHSTQSEITPTALVSTGGAGERGQALTLIPSESRLGGWGRERGKMGYIVYYFFMCV